MNKRQKKKKVKKEWSKKINEILKRWKQEDLDKGVKQ